MERNSGMFHDFPRLAKESGFTFLMRSKRLDWKLVEKLNVDEIEVGRQFDTLERSLNLVLTCDLEGDASKLLDRDFVKLFRVGQLGISYLSFCLSYLDKCVILLQDQLSIALQENNTRQKNTKRPKSVNAYECELCDKTFISESYLMSHKRRRHSPTTAHIAIQTEDILFKKPIIATVNSSTHTDDPKMMSTGCQTKDVEKEVAQVQTEQSCMEEINSNYKKKELKEGVDEKQPSVTQGQDVNRLENLLETLVSSLNNKLFSELEATRPLGRLGFGVSDATQTENSTRRNIPQARKRPKFQPPNSHSPVLRQQSENEEFSELEDEVEKSKQKPLLEQTCTEMFEENTSDSNSSRTIQNDEQAKEELVKTSIVGVGIKEVVNEEKHITVHTPALSEAVPHRSEEVSNGSSKEQQKPILKKTLRRQAVHSSPERKEPNQSGEMPFNIRGIYPEMSKEKGKGDGDQKLSAPTALPRRWKNREEIINVDVTTSLPTTEETFLLKEQPKLQRRHAFESAEPNSMSSIQDERPFPEASKRKTQPFLGHRFSSERSVLSAMRTSSPNVIGLMKRSWSSLFSVVSPTSIQTFTGGLNNRLKELHVDPNWSGIPEETLKRSMNMLEHNRKLMIKKHPEVATKRKCFQKLLERKLLEKTSSSLDPPEHYCASPIMASLPRAEPTEPSNKITFEPQPIAQPQDIEPEKQRSFMYDVESESSDDIEYLDDFTKDNVKTSTPVHVISSTHSEQPSFIIQKSVSPKTGANVSLFPKKSEFSTNLIEDISSSSSPEVSTVKVDLRSSLANTPRPKNVQSSPSKLIQEKQPISILTKNKLAEPKLIPSKRKTSDSSSSSSSFDKSPKQKVKPNQPEGKKVMFADNLVMETSSSSDWDLSVQ